MRYWFSLSYCTQLVLLQNMLHAPKISKNLISVSHLIAHNHVVIEFDSIFFFVKDKATRKVLLQGRNKNGLYQLQQPLNFHNQAQALSVSKSVDITDWHRKLGYPSHKIMCQVLKSCNRSFKFNKTSEFCNACQYGKIHKLPFTDSNSKAAKPLELIH